MDVVVNNVTLSLRKGDINAMFKEAEQLYTEVKVAGLIKDRRYHLKIYPLCFKGNELIDFLLAKKKVGTRNEAIVLGSSLLMHGIIRHVVSDHNFKDEELFFRFLLDDDQTTIISSYW